MQKKHITPVAQYRSPDISLTHASSTTNRLSVASTSKCLQKITLSVFCLEILFNIGSLNLNHMINEAYSRFEHIDYLHIQTKNGACFHSINSICLLWFFRFLVNSQFYEFLIFDAHFDSDSSKNNDFFKQNNFSITSRLLRLIFEKKIHTEKLCTPKNEMQMLCICRRKSEARVASIFSINILLRIHTVLSRNQFLRH